MKYAAYFTLIIYIDCDMLKVDKGREDVNDEICDRLSRNFGLS
jgi:hypothetical protein